MADQGDATATESAETGAGGEAGGEGAAPDPMARLTQAFEQFQTDALSRLDRIEQARAAGDEEYEEDEEGDGLEGLEFEFADEDFDEDGQLSQAAQMREFERMMRTVAREEMAPDREQRETERRSQEADAIEDRYPALRDEAAQDRYIEMAVQEARALGRPELAREPRFLEMVYLQDVGRQGAGEEIPAGSTRGATLERGGGAPPAEGQSSTDEEGDRIVNVSRTQRFRLGS